ncbi:MAG: hypothetical protein AAFX80_04375 [Cyanobacteria bacterium J06639_18]
MGVTSRDGRNFFALRRDAIVEGILDFGDPLEAGAGEVRDVGDLVGEGEVTGDGSAEVGDFVAEGLGETKDVGDMVGEGDAVAEGSTETGDFVAEGLGET